MFNFFFRKNYTKKLARTKSLFSKAYDKAAALVAKMQQDIDSKKAQIAALNNETSELISVQNETKTFMSNLEKFVK